MRTLVPSVMLVAACHYASPGGGDPQPPATDGPSTMIDQTIATEAAPPGCIAPASAIVDTFSGGAPCNPWGAVSMSQSQVVVDNDRLSITPASNGQTHGGCTETGTEAFEAAGVFVEVSATVTGTTAYTGLNAYAADGGVSGRLAVKNNQFTMVDGANAAILAVTYDAGAMRWWRLRPDAAGVVADVSPDAQAWTQIGVFAGTAPATIRLDFGAGTDVAEPSPGTAEFKNLDHCPDE